jgi:hypothetical protein
VAVITQRLSFGAGLEKAFEAVENPGHDRYYHVQDRKIRGEEAWRRPTAPSKKWNYGNYQPGWPGSPGQGRGGIFTPGISPRILWNGSVSA